MSPVDALVERDLAAAPGVLPPANLPLVRHRRGELHRAYGHAGRDQHRARTEPRCSLLQYPHRSLPQLRRETRPAHRTLWTQVVLRGYSPSRCAPTAGASWSATASRSPSAAARCRRSSLLHQRVRSKYQARIHHGGTSLQAVSLLVPRPPPASFAVPLAVRIHEGLVWSNRDRRTLLDKMLLHSSASPPSNNPFYFVADLPTMPPTRSSPVCSSRTTTCSPRMKSNAVAYTAYQQRGPRKRGRPRVYGSKIKLSSLWQASSDFQPAPSFLVYGESKVIIQYPGPRPAVASRRPAGPLRRRDPSHERCLPPHVHRHFP